MPTALFFSRCCSCEAAQQIIIAALLQRRLVAFDGAWARCGAPERPKSWADATEWRWTRVTGDNKSAISTREHRAKLRTRTQGEGKGGGKGQQRYSQKMANKKGARTKKPNGSYFRDSARQRDRSAGAEQRGRDRGRRRALTPTVDDEPYVQSSR